MARNKLAPWLGQLLKNRLVDEELDQKLDALALRWKVSALPWWRAMHSSSDRGLNTAYGTLEWWRAMHSSSDRGLNTAYGTLEIRRDLGGWTATRGEAALVHIRSLPRLLFFLGSARQWRLRCSTQLMGLVTRWQSRMASGGIFNGRRPSTRRRSLLLNSMWILPCLMIMNGVTSSFGG